MAVHYEVISKFTGVIPDLRYAVSGYGKASQDRESTIYQVIVSNGFPLLRGNDILTRPLYYSQ